MIKRHRGSLFVAFATILGFLSQSSAFAQSVLPNVQFRNEASATIEPRPTQREVTTTNQIAGAIDIFNGASADAVASTRQLPVPGTTAIVSVVRPDDFGIVYAGASAQQDFWIQILGAPSTQVDVKFDLSYHWGTNDLSGAYGATRLNVGTTPGGAELLRFDRGFCYNQNACASVIEDGYSQSFAFATNTPYQITLDSAAIINSRGARYVQAEVTSQLGFGFAQAADALNYQIAASPGVFVSAVPEPSTQALFIAGLAIVAVVARSKRAPKRVNAV